LTEPENTTLLSFCFNEIKEACGYALFCVKGASLSVAALEWRLADILLRKRIRIVG
jgi:hypothetical protein